MGRRGSDEVERNRGRGRRKEGSEEGKEDME